MKTAGYAAILRIGLRGSITGTASCGKIRYDNHYEKYQKGAVKAKVPYSVYFFPASITNEEAEAEADWIISNVKDLPLALPVYLDSEMVNAGKGRADRLSRADRTRYLRIITDKLAAAGIPCGVYASTSWLTGKLDMSQLRDDVRKNTWVAQYNTTCTYKGEYLLWQYTSKGRVPGIDGNVDISRLAQEGARDAFVAISEPSGTFPRQAIVDAAVSLVGAQEGTSAHRAIIDTYNDYGRGHGGLPRGYAVKYTDAWCATFCSCLAIRCRYTDIIPVECGCPQWITLAKGRGIWQESDGYVPRPGDFILYDWQDSGSGDNTGTPDHIGVVEKVVSNMITVIEGNYQDAVKRRVMQVNGRYIRGYVTPKYTD